VVRALAADSEDGRGDEPGLLARITRTFLSVAIVFAMTMGLWTASQSPVARPVSNQPAVAGAAAFPGPAAQSSTSPSGRYRTKPIGEIRTGERVLAAKPQVDHAVVTASEIEPATWRNIRLRMRKQHGGTLEIVLLRPLAWLAEQVDEFEQLAVADSHASVLPHAVRSRQNHAGVQLDSDVGDDSGWIHLALPELGAVGPAEVLAIGPCPPLASGPGRTVTGTFAHSAADVLDLEIEGLDTPLGCTANHPFWSADRQDFVPAGSLTIGEHLRTESGTLRQVTRITPRRGPPVPVFNLEVDAEHVYYVSTAGVLVHNAYSGNAPNRGPYRGGSHADMSGPRTRRDGLDSHHMPDRHATPTVDPNDGPAIQMDPLDHFATSSNGRHGESSRIWRDETAQMIREGRYRDAMAREIRDVRRAAKKVSSDPRKYNEAIQEMLEFARRTGQLPARN
jgi:hypothetical protein